MRPVEVVSRAEADLGLHLCDPQRSSGVVFDVVTQQEGTVRPRSRKVPICSYSVKLTVMDRSQQAFVIIISKVDCHFLPPAPASNFFWARITGCGKDTNHL